MYSLYMATPYPSCGWIIHHSFSAIYGLAVYHIEDGTVRDDVHFVESRSTAHIQTSVIENRIECNKSDDWEGGGMGKGGQGGIAP